jgi:hypothetical protein
MGDLGAFIELGFRHIASFDAVDHLLFLVALAATYRPRDWRAVLAVVTAFTVGHSLTLALVATGSLALSRAWVEFLIPVTIVATGVENLVTRDRPAHGVVRLRRPAFALVFGLVHGAGFAGYLEEMLVEDLTWPLLGFNLGVELGQVAMLAVIAVLLVLIDRALTAMRPAASESPGAARGFRLRLVGISAGVIVMGSLWASQRLP